MGEEDPTQAGGELIRVEDAGIQPNYSSEVAELRASIESTRRRIADSLEDLQVEVEEQFDWRSWVDDHPWKAVGLAFAVGLYVGMR